MSQIDVFPDTDQNFQRICEMEHDVLKVMSFYKNYDEVLVDHALLYSWSREEMNRLMDDLKNRVQPDVVPRSAAGWRALVFKMSGNRDDLYTTIDSIQTMNDKYKHIQTTIMKGKEGPMDIEKRKLVLTQLLSIWRDNKDVCINSRLVRFRTTLQEVYMRDDYSYGMSGIGQRNAVVAFHEKLYMGHVFIRQDETFPSVLGMIGIRSSIRNIIGRYCRNMAYTLVYGVVKWAKQNGYEIIKVQFPIGSMPKILSQMGFAQGMGDYWMRVQDFGTLNSQIWNEDKRLHEMMHPPECDSFR
jgi:hypothetical protein